MGDRFHNSRLDIFRPSKRPDLRGTRILLAIGSPSISGGSNLIFDRASFLEFCGAEVHIGHMLGSRRDARWHPAGDTLTFVPLRDVNGDDYDLGIATWYRTFEVVASLGIPRLVYFVQSLENRFALSSGDEMAQVEALLSYASGVPMISVAKWLTNALASISPNVNIWTIRNGINKSLFPLSAKDFEYGGGRPLRALVEGPLGVEMKAVDETLLMLQGIAGIEIWHVSPYRGGAFRSAKRALEAVPLEQMSDIYKAVDVLIKLSRVEGMFGPPLEAMHSGTPSVASRVTGFDEYLVDGFNSALVDVDDFLSARVAIETLRDNPELLATLREGAHATARAWPDSTSTNLEFSVAVHTVLSTAKRRDVDSEYFSKLSQAKSLARRGKSPLDVLDERFWLVTPPAQGASP